MILINFISPGIIALCSQFLPCAGGIDLEDNQHKEQVHVQNHEKDFIYLHYLIHSYAQLQLHDLRFLFIRMLSEKNVF